MKRMKFLCVLMSVLLLVLLVLCSCRKTSGDSDTAAVTTPGDEELSPTGTVAFDTDVNVTVTEGVVSLTGEEVSITLSDDGISCDSEAVTISGSTVTITDEGTYVVTGSLSDGQIIVDAEKTDKVELILNGVGITCATSAPVYLKCADKLKLMLAEGSVNSLVNGGSYVAIDDNNIDAVIFAKDDLTLKGSGTLAIRATAGHGIVAKDDLKVTGGTYIIVAEKKGISVNDSAELNGGSLAITSGTDGIHVENDEDTTLGNFEANGANIKVTSGGDGISASGTLTVNDGYLEIVAGGGYKAKVTDTSSSTKGLKAEGVLTIAGGTLNINSQDDAIHSNSDVVLSGGNVTVASGDDGVHADNNVTVSDGVLNVTSSYEGLEGLTVDITGGTLKLVASDDGINAAGGNDSSGFGGGLGNDRFGPGGGSSSSSSSSSSYIRISGGVIYVNADGDGVDSNGELTVSGGELYVSGPTSNGDGALDFDGTGTITGGTVVAVGSSGMAQNFGSSSTQGSVLLTVGSQSAGTTVTLSDSDGNVLVSYQPESAYASVVISCPGLTVGEKYIVSAGSYSKTITLSSLIYGSGGGMGGGGMGGGPR